MSHVYIKNISSGDSITLASGGDYSGNTVTDDGYIEVSTGGGNSYMIFTDDETTLTTYLDASNNSLSCKIHRLIANSLSPFI